MPNNIDPNAPILDPEISGEMPEGVKGFLGVSFDKPEVIEKPETPPAEEEPNTPPLEEPPGEGKGEEEPNTPPLEEEDDIERDLKELNDLPKGEDKKLFNFRQLEKKKQEIEVQLNETKDLLIQREQRIQELEKEIEKVAFERSPKFRNQFATPREEAKTNVETFAEETIGEKGVVEKALSLKGKERAEFIDDKFGSGAAAAEFVHLLRKYEDKNNSYQKALEDNNQTKALLEAEEKENLVDALRGFDSTRKVLSERLTLFKEIEGNEEHNKLVKQRIAKARSIVTGEASDDDVLYAPFLAVVALEYIKETKNLRTELQKYKQRQKEISKTIPSAGNKSSKFENIKPKGMLAMMQELDS